MRQILESTAIDQWFVSARREAQDLLPHAIRRLIAATVNLPSIRKLRIPVGDEVGRPGYDGVVEISVSHPYVPTGSSVWEMGTGEPQAKANEDYRNRTDDPKGVDPASTAFVFVTPHRWSGKDDWIKEKQQQSRWRSIHVVDDVDLAAWLELSPAVGRWLARQIGRPLEGLADLDTFARELDSRYGQMISADLLVGGRFDAAQRVEEWFRSDTRELEIEGESADEVAAFLSGVARRLPEPLGEWITSRLLFIERPDALEYIAPGGGAHVIVPMVPEVRRRAKTLRSNAIRILSPAVRSAGSAQRTTDVRLGNVRRAELRKALVDMGLPQQRADRIAEECKGSLTGALWMVGRGPDTPLPWTIGSSAAELLPLMLVGQWHADSAADQAMVAKLANRSYSEIEPTLVRWRAPDGPLVHRGELWDWVAWDFAWNSLVGLIDHPVLTRFREVALDVLGMPDPKLDLPLDQRWAADIHGKRHPHSAALRAGLVGSLVQLALHDDAIPGAVGATFAATLVSELLDGDRTPREVAWPTLATWLPDLAEAAPQKFLLAVESLAQDPAGVAAVFAKPGFFGGSSPHVYVLWALERLAWARQYFTHAIRVLADLAAVDPGGQLANRPINTLTEILLPWNPQTTAELRHRLDAVDVLYTHQASVTWRLAISLLPGENQISAPTARPRWRDWGGSREPTTDVEYWQFTEPLVERMMVWAEVSGERLADLVSTYGKLRGPHSELAGKVLDRLTGLDPAALTDADRRVLAERVREFIARNQEFPDAEWAATDAELKRFEDLRERLVPTDPTVRDEWLFTPWPRLPGCRKIDHAEHDRQVQARRVEVVRETLQRGGIPAIIEFAERVERPEAVGLAVAELDLTRAQESELIDRTIGLVPTRESIPKALRLGIRYVSGRHRRGGDRWLDSVLSSGGVTWDDNKFANIAWGLPEESPTWDRLEAWGAGAVGLYWTRVSIYSLRDAKRDAERAIQSLLAAGRPYRALDLAAMCLPRKTKDEKEAIPVANDIIVRVLEQAAASDPESEWFPVGVDMIGHHVDDLLTYLDDQGVETLKLAGLEWTWLAVLRRRERGPRALHRILSSDPKWFVDALKLVFRGEHEEPSDVSKDESTRATNAYRLLEGWTLVPGISNAESGTKAFEGDVVFGTGDVDEGVLRSWVGEARRLATECDRLDVCDSQIGRLLAYSPIDPDGSWPHQAVRNVIDATASERLERGIEIEVRNKRGTHFRERGGAQERRLAAKFHGFAERSRTRWPRTDGMLTRIAQSFDREARLQDERAEFEEFE
jgi:hypothetical protein